MPLGYEVPDRGQGFAMAILDIRSGTKPTKPHLDIRLPGSNFRPNQRRGRLISPNKNRVIPLIFG
jgi:hypothetical protein